LLHGFGDVHPSDIKVRLLDRLASIAPWEDSRVILGLNGADAVEAALKTALLFTGRAGVLAFEGGYHGLPYGTLAECGYRIESRAPVKEQLNPQVVFAPFPAPLDHVRTSIDRVADIWNASNVSIGAVLIEPVQGRGGVRVLPKGFLSALRKLCEDRGALL